MFRQTAGGELESTLGYVRSWLGVPLMIKGEILGMLTLDHSQPGFFTAHHADLILALANQVAIAIENARLYAQAEDMAIATERSRLARDLHDSVTQTLFSASLIADVLPRLWERNSEEGRRRLEELRQLTRGALAEMRTLLMELRPSALVEVELGDLLRQLGEAFTGRSRIPIQLKIEGNAPISPDVKVGLYRIAQEALNNIAKHAGATQVNLNLHSQPDGLELTIADNGCGFDTTSISAEHLGLKIMNERSKEIGVRLTVNSQIGIGTIITARLEN
jgi:signal transduction histidine kinase